MTHRSKIFAAMEQCWQTAQEYPEAKTQDARLIMWSWDSWLNWAVTAGEEGDEGLRAMAAMPDAELQMHGDGPADALFGRTLARNLLSGEWTMDDIWYTIKVISRYQRIERAAAAASPNRWAGAVEWLNPEGVWETLPPVEAMTKGRIYENAAMQFDCFGAQKVKITVGTVSDNWTREFSSVEDIARFIYDEERPIRIMTLALLRWEMLAQQSTDDDAKMPHFGQAEERFLSLPAESQFVLLTQARDIAMHYESALDAEDDGEDE